MTVDRGGRREKRVSGNNESSEQKQIEVDLLQVIPEHANRGVVIKALVNVLGQVVGDAFGGQGES